MTQGSIRIRGARQHNLQNIDIDIRTGEMTVVTGPSGDIPFSGTFTQALQKGHSTLEGLGLIDALSAVQASGGALPGLPGP